MTLRLSPYIISLLILSLLGGALYYKGNDILASFQNVHLTYIFLLVLLNTMYIALGGFSFELLCRLYNIRLLWKDWFGLSFIANLINQCLPYRPGMGFRYFYLSRHYQLSLAHFSIIMLIYFTVTCLWGLLFTFSGYFLIDASMSSHALLKKLLVVCSISIIVILFFFSKFTPIFKLLSLHLKTAVQSSFSLLVMHIVSTILLYYAFTSLGYPLPLLACVFLSGILSLSLLFPITPGNIGILETFFGMITKMLYQDFSIGFSAIALFRITQWIPSILLGTFFSFSLIGKVFPFGERSSID